MESRGDVVSFAQARTADCHGSGSCTLLLCWSEGEGEDAAERRLMETEHQRESQGGGGARDEPHATATEGHPQGGRLGTLAEPGPQRSDRSWRHSSGDALPTLSLSVLAGASGEAVDSAALRYLTANALQAKRKEEAEEEEQRSLQLESAEPGCWVREFDGDGDEVLLAHKVSPSLLDAPGSASVLGWQGKRRKRERRRKQVSLVDDPVIMLLKFQQSLPDDSGVVLHCQFLEVHVVMGCP